MKNLTLALLFALALTAADKPPVISQRQLDRTVAYWQHALKLDDWEIRAHFADLSDLPQGTMGFSHADSSLRLLVIVVLKPDNYESAAAMYGTVPKVGKQITRDVEDTVVHEMIHLRLKQLVEAGNDDIPMAEELAVNRLTSALLAAKHRK